MNVSLAANLWTFVNTNLSNTMPINSDSEEQYRSQLQKFSPMTST